MRMEGKRLPAKALYCYVDGKRVKEVNKDMDGQRETRPCRKDMDLRTTLEAWILSETEGGGGIFVKTSSSVNT